MNFNDVLLIIEKRTKEQQERGQRVMTIRDLDPFIRLKRYFMSSGFLEVSILRLFFSAFL